MPDQPQSTAPLDIKQEGNKIVISKTYDAPRELVYSMFSHPDLLAKWWGPASWPVTIASFDFQPGGIWHYYMTGPDGTKEWGKATFQEIIEPQTLSFTDAFSDEAGTVNETLPQGKVTFTFEESDDQTVIRMTAEYKDEAEVKKLVEMGMIEGVTETWSLLEKLVSNNK